MSAYSQGSAYGPTSPYTQIQRENLNMELALGANPWLGQDPASLLAIAQSGADPEDVITNASAIAGMQTMDSMAEALKGLTPVAQRAVYGKLTEQQQAALQTLGYEPEDRNKGFLDDTPWEGAWDIAANVTSVATRPVGIAMREVGGRALDALMWIGDVPGHFYRAIRQMESWQQWLSLGAGVATAIATKGKVTAGLKGAGSLAQIGGIGATGLAAGVAATAPTALQNPSEWWEVMNPIGSTGVTRGERIFTRSAQIEAREILGGSETFQALARDVAAGIDGYDLAAEFAGVRDGSSQAVLVSSLERVAKNYADPGSPEYQQVFGALQQLIELPEFREAVDTLQASKISFGRDVASALQLEPGDTGYGLVSGTADAFWLLTMDPLLGLGKLGKVQRLWRRGIDTPSGPDAIARLADMVNDDPAIRGVVNMVTDAVNRESFRAMPKQWRPLYTSMLEFKRGRAAKGITGEFDTREFFEYIRVGEGLKAISRGKATVKGVESIVMSTQNSGQGWSRFVEGARRFTKGFEDAALEDDFFKLARQHGVEGDLDSTLVRNYMDHSIDMKFDYHDFRTGESLTRPELTSTKGYTFGKTIGKTLMVVPGGHTLADFVTGFTTMVPAGKALKLTGATAEDMRDVAEDIPRFVEAMGKMMNLPSYVRDEWLDTIMRQDNVAMRRNAALSFLDSTFKATGWHTTDEMKAIADDIIMKHRQAYTLGGGDEMLTPLGERILGSLPELDQAVYIVMPDLREMTKIVRRGHILKNIARIVDHDIAEGAMSRVIKPGWLFRIGFIPRAAGEEMLAFWLRMSEGGLGQEFAARSVAKRRAHLAAKRALAAANGNKNKLTPDQLLALRSPVPAIAQPLVALGRRRGWEPAEAGLLSSWADWQANVLSKGFGNADLAYGKRNLGWADEILLGRDASVRRMILGGVDPMAVKAADKWLAMHASSVMRAASASNASDFERARVNPSTAHVIHDDMINPGRRKNTTVLLRGEKGRVTAGDPQHKNAVYDGATRWVRDGIMRGAAKTVIPRFRPPSIQVDQAWLGNFYESLDGVTSYASKQIVAELLSFRDDNWRAAYANLASLDPNLKEVLRGSVHNGRFDPEEFAHAIQGLRAKKVPVFDEAGDVIGVQPAITEEAWFKLMAIRDEVASVQPFLDELAQLDAGTRKWVGMKFSEYLASDNPADFAKQARAAGGLQPKNVLYRGVQPADLVYNADGSLTIRPTGQGQWAGGKRAISMTTNPEEAMVYASQRVTNTIGTERLGTGVVLKLDADYLAQLNNQTWADVRKSGRSYQTDDGELVRENGMRYIGHADTEATEIAFVTDADEITLPAGTWETLRTDDMRQIVANAADTQWSERVKGVQLDINGVDIEDATIAFVQSMESFRGQFTAPERELLNMAYRERQASYREALEAQYVNLSETVETPDPIFDSLLRTGELDPLDADDAFAQKVQTWLTSEITPGVTNLDMFQAYLKNNDYKYAADDLFQGGVLGNGTWLFQNVDDEILGTNTFQSSNDMLTIIYDAAVRGRGRGAFEDHQTWSPFYETMDDFRGAFINEIVAQLHRPEHQETLKLAEQALHTPDQAAIVRPPADGTARVYTPVVPPQSQVVDEVLAQWNEAIIPEVQAQLDALESIVLNPSADDVEPMQLIDFYITEMRNASLNSGDYQTEAMVEEFFDGWFDITQDYIDETGAIDWELLAEEVDTDQILLQVADILDEVRGPSYEEAAQRLIARSNWVGTDELLDLPEETRLRIVAEAIKHFKASQARYQLGMTQALDGMAVDDPRIARYISNLFSSDQLQKPRVGVITVPRTAPNTSGAALDGLRLTYHDEKYGRVYNVHEMYRDKALPMDAEAFQQIGYTYTDFRGNEVQALEFVPGRSIEESVYAYAEQIVDNWLSQTRRGVKEAQVYSPKNGRTTQVARRGDVNYEPLEPGEVTYGREDLFEIGDDGKVIGPVDFGDNRYFDHQIKEQEDDLMWGVIGPVMRDIYEEEAGFLNSVTKGFREESGFMPGQLSIEDDLEADSFVTMTRSRVDDLDDEPASMLPNVGLTQKYDNLPNTVWDRFIRWGFDKVIGPSIDALARKPMAFHYYVEAYKQQQRHMSWMLNREIFDDVIPELFPDLFAYFNGGAGGFNDVDMIAVREAFKTLVPEQLARKEIPLDIDDQDILSFLVNRYRQDRNGLLVDLDDAYQRLETQKWENAELLSDAATEQNDAMLGLIDEEVEFQRVKKQAEMPDDLDEVDQAYYAALDEADWEEITDRAGRRFRELYTEEDQQRAVDEVWENAKSNILAVRQDHVRFLADIVENDPAKLMGAWKLRDLEGRPYSEIFVEDLADRLPVEAWDTHAAFNAALVEAEMPLETSWEQYSALKSAAENMRHIDAIAEETALYRAIENVIPFLDSHEQRSLFAEYGRNFLPFWYAEENFIKRWARTFALGEFGIPGRDKLPNWAKHVTIPTGGLDALRKAQLTYMGLRSAGIIRTDANGEDWVVYPGSGLLTEAAAKILPGDIQPIGVLFAASTDSMLPGVSPDNTIAPSPFIGIPATLVAHFFPDAKGVKDAMLGPIGSQRGIVDQFVPAVAGNMWEAVFGDEKSSVRYASAMMAAIAYAEAEDRGLPDNATSDQIEEYLDRMRNHARIIMVSQALAGYVVPGAPRPMVTDASGASWLTGVGVNDPEEITSEMYRTYIKNMGIEEGTAAFLREFPNADLEDVVNPMSLTAAGTWSVSGAPLPATEKGINWYENHADWIDSLPEAGAWFMPQDGSNEFEYTAYRQQLVSGLRKRRNPTEFIRSIKFRTASTEYFEVKDEYEKMVEQIGNDRDAKRMLDAQWDRWKTLYLSAHPIFAEELQNGTSRIRRNRQVEQLRYAVADPQAPDSPYKQAITDMVEIFDIFEGRMTILRDDGSGDAKEQMRQLRTRFENFGNAWALENPDLQRLWTSVYRVEAGL